MLNVSGVTPDVSMEIYVIQGTAQVWLTVVPTAQVWLTVVPTAQRNFLNGPDVHDPKVRRLRGQGCPCGSLLSLLKTEVLLLVVIGGL